MRLLCGSLAGLALCSAFHYALADIVYGEADTEAYAAGTYGVAPNQTFVSRPDLIAPAVNIAVSKPGQSSGYIFFGWAGSSCPRPAAVILDQEGKPVYISDISDETLVRSDPT